MIEQRDFRVDDGLDRKKRYGVYEFNVIFICANFLGYYKCYWNFIRRLPVDEDRKKRIGTEGSLRESQIEEAGRIIRDILRQRRIDVMRTKNVDS